MYPMGSSSLWRLNQATHASVASSKTPLFSKAQGTQHPALRYPTTPQGTPLKVQQGFAFSDAMAIIGADAHQPPVK